MSIPAEWTLLPDGSVDGLDVDGPNTWSVVGPELQICTAGCYATYVGALDQTFIAGTASNQNGRTWTFTMERL